MREPRGITIPRLLDLQALEGDLNDLRYVELAVAVNHATNSPEQINKRVNAMTLERRSSHERPRGRAAIPRNVG